MAIEKSWNRSHLNQTQQYAEHGDPILIAAFAMLGMQSENLVIWLSVGAWVGA